MTKQRPPVDVVVDVRLAIATVLTRLMADARKAAA